MTMKLGPMVVVLMILSVTTTSQTYNNNQHVASAPLAWQTQYDPSHRLTIGNDDGNVFASPHVTSYASVIRYGGAQGLNGLLYDFTYSIEGPPEAFGLARRGCVITDATSSECLRARWVTGLGSTVVAIVTPPNGQSSFHIEFALPGDSFSIERVGNTTINFYRSTGVAGERMCVFTANFPYTDDGYPVDTWIETRAVFAPESATKKLSQAQEIYYCCL